MAGTSLPLGFVFKLQIYHQPPPFQLRHSWLCTQAEHLGILHFNLDLDLGLTSDLPRCWVALGLCLTLTAVSRPDPHPGLLLCAPAPCC